MMFSHYFYLISLKSGRWIDEIVMIFRELSLPATTCGDFWCGCGVIARDSLWWGCAMWLATISGIFLNGVQGRIARNISRDQDANFLSFMKTRDNPWSVACDRFAENRDTSHDCAEWLNRDERSSCFGASSRQKGASRAVREKSTWYVRLTLLLLQTHFPH